MYRSILSLFAALTATMVPAVVSAQTLKSAFEAAWTRQPEAAGFEARRTAAQARRRVAESWTAESPVVELGAKNDRALSNNGAAEYQAGLALPLWLPGERGRSAGLAEAESAALESRLRAAQLRVAAEVREAYWAFQRAALDADVAARRLDNARALAADVARRVAAGDLARADAHQAEGSVAAAEVALAEARGAATSAAQRLRALSGTLPVVSANAEPEPGTSSIAPEHPGLREVEDKLEVARRAQELASVQTRANPELLIGTVRERTAFGSAYENSLTVGVRIPLGSEARSEGKLAIARAEAAEAESQLRLQRERLHSDLDAGRARLEGARLQLGASQRRAQLARETRGFFERSFKLGETDLPTRLRVELEAYEAERQAARHAIELAAAVSALRQAIGLLPE